MTPTTILLAIAIWLFIGAFFLGFYEAHQVDDRGKQFAVLLMGPLNLGLICGAILSVWFKK